MRNKLSRIGVVLIAMLLASVSFASAFAGEWEGELAVKPQDGLGDLKDEISDGLEDHELTLIVGSEKTAVSVDGSKIDLGEDIHSVLAVLMNLPEVMTDLSDELKNKASLATEGIKPESNIYSSLFTESQFRKLSSADLADILSCRAFREVMGGIADPDQISAAEDFEGNITFFHADDKYLIILDFTFGGYDYLVNAEYDGFSVSVSAYTDTGVTDWDDTKASIIDGKSDSGRGINVFSMLFGDKIETENYLEIAKYTGQSNTRLELSHDQSASDPEECDLEIVVVRNEEKCMKIQTTLEAAEADLSDAVSWESAVGSVEPATYEALKNCMQVILGE